MFFPTAKLLLTNLNKGQNNNFNLCFGGHTQKCLTEIGVFQPFNTGDDKEFIFWQEDSVSALEKPASDVMAAPSLGQTSSVSD